MSANIKVTLPHEFNPDKRAYFYQSLSLLDYFLLPGTTVHLKVTSGESKRSQIYQLEINFNNTVVKTAIESEEYQSAIKKMMNTLYGKFAEIIEVINKKNNRETPVKKVEDSDKEDDKTIH